MRVLAVLLCALASTPAAAATFCTVNFEKAVTETREGKAAQGRIDKLYADRQGELDQLRRSFDAKVQDFQSRAMVLAEEARRSEEQALAQEQQQLQMMAMQYEQEMQQTYMTMLGDLDQKMREIASGVARERSCTVLLNSQVVVMAGAGVDDITPVLVTRYDQAHPSP